MKKSKWHYKLVCSDPSAVPSEQLCKYFWQVVFALVSNIFIWSFVGAIIVFTLVVVLAPIVAAIFPVGPNVEELAKAGLFVWGLIGGPLLVHGLCVFFGNKKKRKRCTSKKEPGIMRSYLKAKKKKFCPTIKFTDE